MYIPDTLSRAYQTISKDTDLKLQEHAEVMVHSVVESLPVSSTKMDQFRRENKSDPEMQAIHTQVQKGGLCIKQKFLILQSHSTVSKMKYILPMG